MYSYLVSLSKPWMCWTMFRTQLSKFVAALSPGNPSPPPYLLPITPNEVPHLQNLSAHYLFFSLNLHPIPDSQTKACSSSLTPQYSLSGTKSSVLLPLCNRLLSEIHNAPTLDIFKEQLKWHSGICNNIKIIMDCNHNYGYILFKETSSSTSIFHCYVKMPTKAF